MREFARFAHALYEAYVTSDATIAEINPLAVTESGKVVALDAKMVFDDSALWRHPRIAAMRDPWRRTRGKTRPASSTCSTSRSTATSPAS